MSVADDTRILNAMFHRTVVLPLESVDGKMEVVLTEKNAPDSKVRIRALPEDSVVVKIGAFPDTRNFFESGHNLNHRADYMIVCPSDKTVVYVELKRGHDKRSEIVAQLRGAACTGGFIREIGAVHFAQGDFLRDYRKIFVGFSHATVNKTVTGRPEMNGSGATPEDLRRFNFANRCQFNKLVA